MKLSRSDEETANNSKISFSENESKNLIANYGVPVVREKVAKNFNEAKSISESIGFPVVLKGHGRKLSHKTERGLVHLNIGDVEALKTAADSITREAKEDLEGFLIQPYVKGKREFVAGMFRDHQFGPVIMFGLGGIFTGPNW